MLADNYLIVTEDQLKNLNPRSGLHDVVSESERSRPCKSIHFHMKTRSSCELIAPF
jgi:hypothetical protein